MDELLMRARALKSAPAHRWGALFRDTFVQDNGMVERLFGEGCSDDILFFVSTSPETWETPPPGSLGGSPKPQAEAHIRVLRKTADAVIPSVCDGGIRWRETFYLNLIASCHFELVVSTYHRVGAAAPRLLHRVAKRVYASPSSLQPEKADLGAVTTFPKINFTVDDFDTAFSDLAVSQHEVLSVELVLSLPAMSTAISPVSPEPPCTPFPPPAAPEDPVVPPAAHRRHPTDEFGGSISEEDRSLPDLHDGHQPPDRPSPPLRKRDRKVTIFSGSIPYPKLAACFLVKQHRRIRKSAMEYINMVGPGGKGVCQVAVRDPFGSAEPPEPVAASLLRRAWAVLAAEPKGEVAPPVLQTGLTSISVHWEAIIEDLNSWLPEEP